MTSFLRRLQDRNVIKAAISYVAVSWAILEGADMLFPILHLPQSVLRALFIVLVIGFPAWVVFAYLYERTPKGFKKSDEVAPDASMTKDTSRKLNAIIIAGLLLAVTFLLADRFFNFTEAVFEGVDPNTIAVLPFENQSSEEDDYFAAGITEDILTQIAKINELKVLSRFTLKDYDTSGKTPKEIGKELKVRHLLVGSIRRSGDQLRIGCQLINTATETEDWANTFDRKMEDVFAIQSEVAREVASLLKVQLSPEEVSRIDEKPTENIIAYNYYLEGREAYSEYNAQSNAKALELFKRAIELDPGFALAWAGLGDAAAKAAAQYTTLPIKYIDSAFIYSEKAVELDPTLAEAWKALAQAYNYIDKSKVRPSLEKAVMLNPRHFPSVANLALILAEEGKLDESIKLYKKAIELSPLASLNYSNIANRYLALQMYAEAEENLKIAVELDPENWHALYTYSLLYSGLGMYENAKIYTEKSVKLDPDNIYYHEQAGDITKDFDIDLAEKHFAKVYSSPKFDPEIYQRTAIFFGTKNSGKSQEPPSDQLLNKTIDLLSDKANKGELNSEGLLILTQAYAALGDKSTAISWLEKSFQSGLVHDRPIKKDYWLRVLNDDPKFNEMVDQIDKKVAEMRENLQRDDEAIQ